MTIDEQLDAIEARVNAATAGPWECDHEFWDGVDVVSVWHGGRDERGEFGAENILCDIGAPIQELGPNPQALCDGQFIAHARTDVPRLVKALRRATEVLNFEGPDGRYRDQLAAILDGERE